MSPFGFDAAIFECKLVLDLHRRAFQQYHHVPQSAWGGVSRTRRRIRLTRWVQATNRIPGGDRPKLLLVSSQTGDSRGDG